MGRVPPCRTWGDELKVLITGGAGLVAGYLWRSAPAAHRVELTWRDRPPPAGSTSHRIDLTDAEAAAALFDAVAPEVVVHTAYSMTDRAAIVDATANVAAACAHVGAALVHLSTDTVFSGDDPPYVESDAPCPITDYGRWKAEAEAEAVTQVPDACITRTSLVVSLDPPDPSTAWLLRSIGGHEPPTLFSDELRTPIRADDLAAVLWALVDAGREGRAGRWHLPGPEVLSRWQLGERVVRALGLGDPAELVRPGSILDHPSTRCADLTLASERVRPGPSTRPVP